MIPAERHKTILQRLQSQAVLSIHELTVALGVSHMTIRRDISRLESQGKVKSVVGGVQLVEHLHSEPSHTIKSALHRDQKLAIGRTAEALIPLHACIYLDAGTTTLEIAHQLIGRSDVCVITNDFAIAAFLMNNSECVLYHTGGKIDRANQSCVGEKAARFLQEFNIDLAFVSTSSWGPRGISTPSEDKVAVKRAIIDAAYHNYLVCDSSKYGKVAPFHAVELTRFEKVITDSNLPEVCVADLQQRHIQVLLADIEIDS